MSLEATQEQRAAREVFASGADLVLVGTSLARTAEPAAAVRALTGVRRTGRQA